MRSVLILLAAVLTASGADLPASWQAALSVPRADSIRGHVSFLASDFLEGRDTPSRGLDIAAEYIAAQFRRAGVDPAGHAGYFHTSRWIAFEPNPDGMKLSFTSGAGTIEVPASAIVPQSPDAVQFDSAPVVAVNPGDLTPLDGVASLGGKVVLARGTARTAAALLARLRKLDPLAIILIDPRNPPRAERRLVRADSPAAPPVLMIRGGAAQKLATLGPSGAVAANIPESRREAVTMRNVIGILRGSDAALADSYLVLSAHYDHMGIGGTSEDTIYNGANDNASGVAGLVEAASSLAMALPRPKRSIVFVAFAGEEDGMLGSREYVRNPTFPISKTIGNLNFEQLGRTDSDDGPHENRVTMTGFGYSTLTPALVAAGERLGITVYRHEKNSEAFFTGSDNISFAEAGVPAHTLSTGFLFPEYHRPGDHWEKLDYPHMEKLARLITLGALMIADSAEEPKWDAENPRTQRFREAKQR